jgi:hypothetical protein
MVLLGLAALTALLLGQSAAKADPMLAIDQDSGTLYQVNTANAALTPIGGTGLTSSVGDITFAPDGTLYAITTSAAPVPSLYTINPHTAAATLVGPLGIGFVFEGALAFAPNGTLYGANQGSSGSDTLFTINRTTGAATTIGSIGSHDLNGFAFRSDGKLVALDRVTNSLLLIDPNTLAVSTLAAIGPTVGAVGGLTISGTNAFFSTSGPGGSISGSNSLYSFDPFTGSSTLVGSFAPTITGDGISGIALPAPAAPPPAVPEPSTFAQLALGGGALAGWRRWRKRATA